MLLAARRRRIVPAPTRVEEFIKQVVPHRFPDPEPFSWATSPSQDVQGTFCGRPQVAKSFYSLLWSNCELQIIGQTWRIPNCAHKLMSNIGLSVTHPNTTQIMTSPLRRQTPSASSSEDSEDDQAYDD